MGSIGDDAVIFGNVVASTVYYHMYCGLKLIKSKAITSGSFFTTISQKIRTEPSTFFPAEGSI
jgi:hypothetical protein